MSRNFDHDFRDKVERLPRLNENCQGSGCNVSGLRTEISLLEYFKDSRAMTLTNRTWLNAYRLCWYVVFMAVPGFILALVESRQYVYCSYSKPV